MDRNEAMLRELNLYPQWVRRNMPPPVVVEQASPVAAKAETIVSVVSDSLLESAQSLTPDRGKDGMGMELPITSALTPALSPSPSPINVRGELSWPELKQQVRDCTLCKLRAGCTQTVFGVGDEKADWLFVGEGPGADEDALGEPFVGQAGKLLDNMLMAIKLKRGNNVYIANIVKCRPPGNRPPEADEIATCLPYLHRQIALIQPKLIVALGKVASNALLGKDATLASLRGKLHDYRGTPLVVTYHPAYLLRTPSEKAKAWQDLCLAVKTLEGDA
jgi:DNA polymerase